MSTTSSRDRTAPAPVVPLEIGRLVDDRGVGVIVCCGAGGVGKTTLAAATAVLAAERGRKTVVLTIDPARRLAQALGVRLDNRTRPVPGVGAGGGSLDATMLDMKATFDDLVRAHASPEVAAEVMENRLYRSLSESLSGTQEYMAVERLGQLHADGRWDLVVVDTPPSRSALDFLDAPRRIASFLDGKVARLLLAPARTGGRRLLRVVSMPFSVVRRVIGVVVGKQLLGEISSFLAAVESVFGGFRERASAMAATLSASDTAFVVVSTPRPDALVEASCLVDRLVADAMPLAGVVVNNVRRTAAPDIGVAAARAGATLLRERGDSPVTAAVLSEHARLMERIEAERRALDDFHAQHPLVPIAVVPAGPVVEDMDGLRAVASALDPDRSTAW